MRTGIFAALCCVVGALSGCATIDGLMGASADSVSYELTSVPNGSTVFVNGESKGVTPLALTLEAKKRWVGVLVAPGGWKYENNFYFIEVVPSANDRDRYLSDSTYLNPRNPDLSNKVHFELPQRTPSAVRQQDGSGKILGIKESLLPTFKSTGYVRMLQINGKPLAAWGANPYAAELPVGRYSIATLCNWDLGIRGEVKIENMWTLKLDIASGKTYQLETEQLPNNRCRVYAKASD